MKIPNLFKKNTKAYANSRIEGLAKDQLEKVIGGTNVDNTTVEVASVLKTKHDTVKNSINNVR